MYNNDLPKREELPSSKQLLRSTFIAIVIATVLLTIVVLPAEYAVDATGIGRVLGLTQMGEIKMTLAEEAKRDREATAAQATQSVAPQSESASQERPLKQGTPTSGNAPSSAATRNDSMTVTLKPGQGVEIKLDMLKGKKATYEWTTTGGGLNYDIHGDNTSKAFISYKKGNNAEQDSGEIIADFDGSHGWFWRNRTAGDVTVILKTSGEYTEIKRVV